MGRGEFPGVNHQKRSGISRSDQKISCVISGDTAFFIKVTK